MVLQAKPTFTKEELQDAERRAKEYSRQKSYQNLAWRRDMETKFRLRNEAFAALPGTLLLAIVLAIWARRRMDPQERPLAPQVGGSLALAALYLTGTWLGS